MQKIILLLLLEVSLFAASRYAENFPAQSSIPLHENENVPPKGSPPGMWGQNPSNVGDPNGDFEPPLDIWKRLKKTEKAAEQDRFLEILMKIESEQRLQKPKDVIGSTFYSPRNAKPTGGTGPIRDGSEGDSASAVKLMSLRLKRLSEESSRRLSTEFAKGSLTRPSSIFSP